MPWDIRSAPVRRPERPSDEAFMAALFGETHGAILAGIELPLAAMLLRHQRAGQRWSYCAAYPGARFDVVEVDGDPVGRVVTQAAEVALTLVDIALLPAWRGRGLGTRLLGAIQDEARADGLPVRLSVRRGNVAARRLYSRLGFVPAGGDEVALSLRWTP